MIHWLDLERKIRYELKEARENSIVEPSNETNIETLREALKLARMALHRIDLALGDETGRGYELEGRAPAGWLD